ncbi:hypothetical protein HID58_084395 [Brassica napus]|uniref:BnaCnng30940D protein n=4 Tax=Brassica TaxID=3705 RepID=A0A078IXK7_BRANA|nr:PREDICTED: uncharacterized protein LOC106317216 [Brassica oleracea var. oleracea]XP_013718711.2 FCS-Like Zinc finger 15 [Brassica napus]KAH0856134.1 hypothetical protein HID58_084395 [Brassica napus]CAF1715879.1 unnamed protein product [Brassica napus]CDY56677.1 BnaCnng30940D [Brassica napus]
MVGLSIILESTNNNNNNNTLSTPKPHQVVNKSAVMVSSDLRRGNCYLSSGFLEHCFLCRKKLLPAKDIYMYKGDRAFCSVECRSKQMTMDEEVEEESLTRENCSFTAVNTTTSDSSSGGHRRDPGNRAGGGFAF